MRLNKSLNHSVCWSLKHIELLPLPTNMRLMLSHILPCIHIKWGDFLYVHYTSISLISGLAVLWIWLVGRLAWLTEPQALLAGPGWLGLGPCYWALGLTD